MKTNKLILLAIMAGVYSGILNELEGNLGLNHLTSILILSIVIFITGYLLNKIGEKKKIVNG